MNSETSRDKSNDEPGESRANLRLRVAQLERDNARLTEQLAARDAAMALATSALDHDVATGLPNRRSFVEQLQRALARSRVDGSPLALVAVHIRDFAARQAALAPGNCDQLLSAIGFRLRQNLRPLDVVARVDDDQFALILVPGPEPVGDLAARATGVALRAQHALAGDIALGSQGQPVRICTAVVIHPDEGDDAFELLYRLQAKFAAQADRAMPRLRRNAARREIDQIEHRLLEAIENRQLRPWLQPQVDARDGRIVGAEALARWSLGDGRFVDPKEFMPAAESAGLSEALDSATLANVAAQLVAWRELAAPLRVAVNISSASFHSRRLVPRVRELIQATGVEPTQLLFEITESVMITDFAEAQNTIKALRDLGIAVALDDFGTGYSALSYLHRLPLDAVKIDRSFVQDLGTGGDEGAVISAVVGLAASLKLQVIAEGVETAEQARLLGELGCQVLQGFYYSKAVPMDRFETLWRGGLLPR